jgi:predicted ATP-dependent protease
VGMPIKPLAATKLYRRCNSSKLAFRNTSELEDLDRVIGQERALEALDVALNIARGGYNLYALGPAGLGKHSTVKRFIEQARNGQSVPDAWCYLHNFSDPKRPKALALPAEMAKQFVGDMDSLVQELQAAITAALESDEFRARRDAIEDTFKERQEKGLKEIQERARGRGVAMIHTPAGIGFAPMQEGEVLRPDQFNKLSPEKKKEIERVISQLQDELQELMQSVPRQLRESRKKLQELTREAITFAVQEPIGELQKRYAKLPKVVEHLDGLREDVIEHAGDFIRGEEGTQQQTAAKDPLVHVPGSSPFDRYKVNLLVEREEDEGPPLVYEVNPTYNNLVGTIEHASQMGALVTDFTLIKPGALHRANGGYLLLDARRLLQQPFAYEALKQALRIGKIRLEPLGQALSLISTVSLEPEPIPLQVKVVLIGERMLYYLLCHYDPDFPDLFKVAADFAEEIDWDDESLPLYARLIATLARRNELRPLKRRAVARVIEQGARIVNDSGKLSIRLESISDLLREADYWCQREGKRLIDASHVQRAVDAHEFRNSRIRDRLQEQVMRETMLIDTDGERVGQINGLAVLQLGGYAFGRPSRISATARLGKGELLDIEREVQLGGPIHSKGVLILAGFSRRALRQEGAIGSLGTSGLRAVVWRGGR